MKHILYLLFFICIPFTSISSQENKSRFGVEVGIIPWHLDTFSEQTPFSISGFIGGYYEHFLSNSWSLKTTIGLHNATYKWWGDSNMKNKERFWQTTIEIAVEPRYYFWEKQQNWGTVFAALPVSVELGPFQNKVYNIFEIPTIKAIPAIGYQYYITRNWFMEANAGLGWSLDRYPSQSFNNFDYLFGIRSGISF